MARKPTMKFQRGESYTLTLNFDEPKQGTTKDGRPYVLYGATYNGQEVAFFTPSDHEHHLIQATGAGQGDTITIAVDRKGNWHVGTSEDQLRENPMDPFADPNALDGVTPAKTSWESMVERYQACIAEANRICVAEFETYTNEDIRTIATTLYIQANQKGVEIPNE